MASSPRASKVHGAASITRLSPLSHKPYNPLKYQSSGFSRALGPTIFTKQNGVGSLEEEPRCSAPHAQETHWRSSPSLGTTLSLQALLF